MTVTYDLCDMGHVDPEGLREMEYDLIREQADLVAKLYYSGRVGWVQQAFGRARLAAVRSELDLVRARLLVAAFPPAGIAALAALREGR
jgi:hypothetical protein